MEPKGKPPFPMWWKVTCFGGFPNGRPMQRTFHPHIWCVLHFGLRPLLRLLCHILTSSRLAGFTRDDTDASEAGGIGPRRFPGIMGPLKGSPEPTFASKEASCFEGALKHTDV